MTPQAFISSYAPRLRTYGNSLLTPVIPQTTAQNAPLSRTTKRGTIAINYAENEYDDDDIFEDSEGPRRHTGLRSRREDPNLAKKEGVADKLGREIHAPVDVQGIWREWMGKLRSVKTDKQLHAPTALPLTLIPIRIDLDIPSYQPHAPIPLPPEWQTQEINSLLPAYRKPEPTPPYRLKDIFLWNLHETLITPDQFATILIHDLDLPPTAGLAIQVSKQIREQLEEYAGVALHPLFHATDTGASNGAGGKTIQVAHSRDQSSTPAVAGPSTPQSNVNGANGHISPSKPPTNDVTATASPLPAPTSNLENDPDDTYRCIVNLNINLQNKLYTDKFEWSLLHPVGVAEHFAKLTCADMGLHGEWIPAIAHAIYEAVLRLKKEACESGGLVGGLNGYGAEIDNIAVHGEEAGWRYDDEHLGQEWEPRIERLSKEDMEKREGDRERQLRRLRRETARFSSTTNMAGGMPTQQPGYGDQGDETPAMGRGERSKRKKRFRSLSPVARATPDVGNAGYGGGGAGSLNDWERQSWRCSHCLVHGSAVWAVRDGPMGPRSLCNNCGLAFERDKRLPPWAKKLHLADIPLGR